MSARADRRPQGRLLTRFVVVADTHTNQAEDESPSPYEANRLANARCRHVLAEIDSLDPAFVVHLGDIVHPVPELPTYGAAAEAFHETARVLRAPLHVVPGNHDIGDKVIAWAPAASISDDKIELYTRHFGPHFYAAEGAGLHLVVINAPLINSGLAAEAEQKAWLEADLAANAGRRTFLFIHHPPFISDPGEGELYDNIDEPGRSWLLDLMRRYRPEAMFCGHVHNFWYNLLGETEVYLLPSTAFVRHDYSELFRIGPVDEDGRNDRAKLGYVVVDVFERGHVAHNIRSHGRTLAPGVSYVAPSRPAPAPHTRLSAVENLGVDLRHPWAEEVELPPSGALEEFARKKVRNDYPLQALWEMGLRRLRVPLADLTDPRVRDRMAALAGLGHLFQVYHFGLPQGAARRALIDHAGLVHALELVADWSRAEELAEGARRLKADGGPAMLLSRVGGRDHGGGARFSHLVGHGFPLGDTDALAAFAARHAGLFAGAVLRLPREVAPLQALPQALALGREIGGRACLYVKSTGGNIAEHFDDDAANARRVAEATVAALTTPEVDLVLDSFVDVDRGYLVRTGLVDRRYNPRPAGRVLAHLVGLMGDGGWRLGTAGAGEIARLLAPDGATWRLLDGAAEGAADLDGEGAGPWLARG